MCDIPEATIIAENKVMVEDGLTQILDALEGRAHKREIFRKAGNLLHDIHKHEASAGIVKYGSYK